MFAGAGVSGSGRENIAASRGSFFKIIAENTETSTLDVFKTLSVEEASIKEITNNPLLREPPTDLDHIANRRYVEALVTYNLKVYNRIGIINEIFSVNFSSISNDVVIVQQLETIGDLPPLSLQIEIVPGQFYKFKLINTTSHLITVSGPPGVLLYNTFYNPSGIAPLFIQPKCQANFSYYGGNWYVTL